MHHDKFTRGERLGMIAFALIVAAIVMLSALKMPERVEATPPPPPRPAPAVERIEKPKADSTARKHKRAKRSPAKKAGTADKRLSPTEETLN